MKQEEYLMNKSQLIEKHKQELKQLDLDYVMKNLKFKKGDIIRDHVKKIKVEGVRVGYNMDNNTPQAVYFGDLLNNNNTLKIKGGGSDSIWEENIIS
jgi:ethanolamine utilization protein EutQ (cupin superfamily)